MQLTDKEKRHLLRYIGVKIKRNRLTNKYYWAQYFYRAADWYASDGLEYDNIDQAINAFLVRAISPE